MRSRRSFLLSILLGLLLTNTAARADDPAAVRHVDASGASKLIKDDPKVVLIDIRTPEEFAAGRIKGASNINYYAGDFRASLRKLDATKTYLVYCASGGRSTKSLELFQKLGFKSVVHLDGGFKAWEKAGNAVEK